MKKLAKGFTLIELMIVVAIIGILAAIAIPNFIKYQLRSKFSEASSNIEGLRKAEESLRQGERMVQGATGDEYVPGQYWDMTAVIVPTGDLGTSKIAWPAADLTLAGRLDWQVEGASYFQYQVATGCDATVDGSQSGMCYSVTARADIDGDSTLGGVVLVKQALNTGDSVALPNADGLDDFPGTVDAGSQCVDRTGATVFGMPCTLSAPDIF